MAVEAAGENRGDQGRKKALMAVGAGEDRRAIRQKKSPDGTAVLLVALKLAIRDQAEKNLMARLHQAEKKP